MVRARPELSVIALFVVSACAMRTGSCALAPAPGQQARFRDSPLERFAPEALPKGYRWLERYATFPTGARALAVDRYLGVAKAFYWQAGRFLKPQYLPDAAFLRARLLLVPSAVESASLKGLREDVAFLRYRVGDTDVLMSQTGSLTGRVCLFVVGVQEKLPGGAGARRRLVESLLNRYLHMERFGKMELSVQAEEATSLSFLATVGRPNKPPRFRGYLAGGRLALAIRRVQPDELTAPGFSRWGPGRWFEASKDLGKGIPLEDFGTYDRKKVFRTAAKPEAEDLPPEVAEAIREKDTQALVRFAAHAPWNRLELICAAIGTTREGRDALLRLWTDNPRRYTDPVLHAARSCGAEATDLLTAMLRADGGSKYYDEIAEAVVKRMPKDRARRFCLEQAQTLAEQPDANATKLIFFVRVLRQNDDPPELRVLRRILREAHDKDLREETICVLAKWVLDGTDARRTIVGDLAGRLGEGSDRARSAAVRAIGDSGDPRNVPLLTPLLDDPSLNIRHGGARAICVLLGWRPPPRQEGEEEARTIGELKQRLAPVLQAIRALQAAIKQDSGNR